MLFFVLFNVGFVRYISEISDLFLVVFLSDLRWILYDIQYVGNFRCIYQKLPIYFATVFFRYLNQKFPTYIYRKFSMYFAANFIDWFVINTQKNKVSNFFF